MLETGCRPTTPQGIGDKEMTEPQDASQDPSGSCSLLGPRLPSPLLKQGVLLAALHLGPLGPSCP